MRFLIVNARIVQTHTALASPPNSKAPMVVLKLMAGIISNVFDIVVPQFSLEELWVWCK